jgi:aquaporin Z
MNKYGAEFVGTFVLVFVGIGTAVLDGANVGFLGVGIAFGLALLAMAYTIGPISGCHINPAVTLGLLMAKKMDAKDVAGYVIAQVLGGIAGAGVVFFIANAHSGGFVPGAVSGFASNGYGEHSPFGYSMVAAFAVEVLLTGLLVFTVLGSTDIAAPAGFAGLPIGLVLIAIHFVGIPIDNLSANPARSIATAVFTGGWALGQLWLFIVAPLIGGALAALLYQSIRNPEKLITAKTAEEALPSDKSERAA